MTKIPRFAFEKFPGAEPTADDLDEIRRRSDGHRPHLCGIAAEGAALAGDGPHRSRRDRSVRTIRTRSARRWRAPRRTGCASTAQAMRYGFPIEDIAAITKYDPWFLRRDRSDPRSRSASARERACRRTPTALRRLKSMGFSDARLAKLDRHEGKAGAQHARHAAACARCSSASTPAPPNSRR